MKHTASNQRKQPTLGIVTGMAVVGFLSGQMAIAHNNDYTNQQAWKWAQGDATAGRYIPTGGGVGTKTDGAGANGLDRTQCDYAKRAKPNKDEFLDRLRKEALVHCKAKYG